MAGPNEIHPLLQSWREGHTFHLDVRPLLEAGIEPYPYIMDSVQQVAPGEALTVHALFEPLPLVRQVKRMGLAVECRRLEPEHWVVEISRAG